MKTTFIDHPFNTFATVLRQNETVKLALERLQQQHSLNANFILYAIWYGQNQRGRLYKQDIKSLMQTIQSWHERVLASLQRLRNLLDRSSKTQSMREVVNKEIIYAEKVERCLIADTISKLNHPKRNPTQQLSDACYNLTHYCMTLRIRLDEADKSAITTLLQAAFPNLIAAEINDVCENTLNHPTQNEPSFSQLSLSEI